MYTTTTHYRTAFTRNPVLPVARLLRLPRWLRFATPGLRFLHVYHRFTVPPLLCGCTVTFGYHGYLCSCPSRVCYAHALPFAGYLRFTLPPRSRLDFRSTFAGYLATLPLLIYVLTVTFGWIAVPVACTFYGCCPRAPHCLPAHHVHRTHRLFTVPDWFRCIYNMPVYRCRGLHITACHTAGYAFWILVLRLVGYAAYTHTRSYTRAVYRSAVLPRIPRLVVRGCYLLPLPHYLCHTTHVATRTLRCPALHTLLYRSSTGCSGSALPPLHHVLRFLTHHVHVTHPCIHHGCPLVLYTVTVTTVTTVTHDVHLVVVPRSGFGCSTVILLYTCRLPPCPLTVVTFCSPVTLPLPVVVLYAFTAGCTPFTTPHIPGLPVYVLHTAFVHRTHTRSLLRLRFCRSGLVTRCLRCLRLFGSADFTHRYVPCHTLLPLYHTHGSRFTFIYRRSFVTGYLQFWLLSYLWFLLSARLVRLRLPAVACGYWTRSFTRCGCGYHTRTVACVYGSHGYYHCGYAHVLPHRILPLLRFPILRFTVTAALVTVRSYRGLRSALPYTCLPAV